MTTATVAVPKHIKVAGHKIRFRLPQSVLWGIGLSLAAVGVMAGGYYLLLQTRYVIGGHQILYLKPWWDGLFKQDWWTNYRHGVRNVGEGVLAAIAVHTFISPWRKHPDERLSGVALAVRGVVCLVLALALIIVGVWIVDYAGPWAWHALLGHRHVTAGHGPSWIGTVLSGINWQSFVLGFVVTHAARFIWRPVGNTISLSLLEGSVYRAQGRTPLWVRLPLAPPAVRERFTWIQQNTTSPKPHRDIATRVLLWIVVLCLPLAGYGEYVLHVIAKGK